MTECEHGRAPDLCGTCKQDEEAKAEEKELFVRFMAAALQGAARPSKGVGHMDFVYPADRVVVEAAENIAARAVEVVRRRFPK